MTQLACRFCSQPLDDTFVDLGVSPFANSYLTPEACNEPETFFPLHVFRCTHCHLVQLPEFESPEAIFRDYAYFSSFADSLLAHCKAYASAMCERFDLDAESLVIEAASNDGYLLRFFRERAIPVLGIEPARNVAAAAEKIGIPTVTEFFGTALADQLISEGRRADLMVANNVLAHTPHLNDFVAGLARVLAPSGVLTIEFPHLMALVENNQFDTIYHEHFSYFSLLSARAVLAAHELTVFDVERLSTHGGSLRLFAHRANGAPRDVRERVTTLAAEEEAKGYHTAAPYRGFADRVRGIRRRLLTFLIEQVEAGATVAGYGAPAKANTLFNYCGVRRDLLPFTVDRSPHKQGMNLPGTRIPILAPEALRENRPDFVLILPWNLRAEIESQLADLHAAGTRFVVAIPDLEILP